MGLLALLPLKTKSLVKPNFVDKVAKLSALVWLVLVAELQKTKPLPSVVLSRLIISLGMFAGSVVISSALCGCMVVGVAAMVV